MMKQTLLLLAAIVHGSIAFAQEPRLLNALIDSSGDKILVRRGDAAVPVATQVATSDHRPFLHPIAAPDGKGILTEFSPSHHKHQTGLFWGFTRVNGRDYFHHPESSYWKRVSVVVLKHQALAPEDSVQWQTIYDLLDETGNPILRESQVWTMRDFGSRFTLDLEWSGEALTDVTVGKYDYGGLFLRMPWKPSIQGQVMNNARQVNQRAEGQRAVWTDVGMKIDGRDDMAHITIFDHPQNKGFPQTWRVDDQLGIGPVRARMGDWTISKGQKEIIKHQIVVSTGDLNDVATTELWATFSGQGMAFAQWQLAQQEGRRAEFLTPEKAVANMTMQPGFQTNVYASEPMMAQPMAFCFDARGRIWIAENLDYETRQSGFSNDGKSRISILEDKDRDGVAESRKTFLEGIPFPAGIAVGMGGLWLGAPPNLLFVPDRDGDDKADVNDIQIRLTGWGIRDRHETLNSFIWGPDGWLYGTQGYATPSRVGKPKGAGKLYKHKDPFPENIAFEGEPVDINGGVWRYHPTKDRFEVLAHGFSNPWGIDYDAKGQLFITACVIPHLWHVIPGGIYHRQGGTHFSPHVYSDIRTIADHAHQSAHGGARVYQSDAFPDRYKGRIFMANIHEHAVLTDILEPKGSGFVGHHGDDFMLANNAQWIGFSIEVGPEGSVYVLDWHDADICGKEVLNKDTGRIFRISAKQSLSKDFAGRFDDINKQSDATLATMQQAPSVWHTTHARMILQHRATSRSIDEEAIRMLRSFYAAPSNEDLRLRAMWTLHAIGQMPADHLQQALSDRDAHVRAWAIQLLCEDKRPAQTAIDRFVELAKTDPSPIVRLYLASAIQRVDESGKWRIAESLAMHGEDSDDHNLPKMIWFGLEPSVVKSTERSLVLAESTKI
ncbi:MAG: PVC-type heme-binding CxxCH protein, partial [Pirellula sp.]